MEARVFGAGIIGKGDWGTVLAKHLNRRSDFELLHIADTKYPLGELWIDRRVDLVVIATPNQTHYELTMKSLEAGKHVLVEKPMCYSATEISSIEKLSKLNDLHVITDYTQTFSPSLRFIASGNVGIGDIRAYDLSVSKLRSLPDVNSNSIHWLMVSHLLSILDMFEPIDTFCYKSFTLCQSMGIPSNVLVAFSNGCLRASLDNPDGGYQIIFYGRKGVATYSSVSNPSIRASYHTRQLSALKGNVRRTTWNFREDNNLEPMLTYVRDVLNGHEDSNFAMSARVTRALASISRD